MTEDASPENLRKFLESDDPALVRMGLSMAKGAEVSDEILEEILWMYLFHDDKTIRAAARSTFMKLAPEDVKLAVKKNWKANYRTIESSLENNLYNLEKGLSQTSVSLARQLIKDLDIQLVDDDKAYRRHNVELNQKDARVAAVVLEKLGWKPDTDGLRAAYLIAKQDWEECIKLGEPAVLPLINFNVYFSGDPWRFSTQVKDIREHIVIVLGEIGDKRAVKSLIVALDPEDASYRDYRVQKAAAEALSKIGDRRAVKPLIKVIRQVNDSELYAAAAYALGKIGDRRAVEPFIKELLHIVTYDDGYNSNCETTIEMLGKFGGAQVVEPLIKTLGVRDDDSRTAAHMALLEIGKPEPDKIQTVLDFDKNNRPEYNRAVTDVVPSLIKALGDDNALLRETAAKILEELGWKPDPREGTHIANLIAKQDWEECIKLGEPAVLPLIKVLEGDDWKACVSAAEALAEIGDERSVEPLIKVLPKRESDEFITSRDNERGAAIKALRKFGDKRAVKPLTEVLDDKRGYIARDAAEALGDIGDVRAVEPLIKALGNDDLGVRDVVAKALDKLKWKPDTDGLHAAYLIAKQDWEECIKLGESAVLPLIKILRFETGTPPNVRYESQWVASQQRHVDGHAYRDLSVDVANESMIESLGPLRPSYQAVLALGKIGDVRAVEALIEALGVTYFHSRLREKLKDSDINKAATEVLWEFGEDAIESLIKALGNDDADIRQTTDKFLTKTFLKTVLEEKGLPISGTKAVLIQRLKSVKVDDTRGIKPLIKGLDNMDPNARSAAVVALGKLGDRESVEPLLKVISDVDSNVRKAAVKVLGDIGDVRAVEPLIKALKDGAKGVRLAAVKALENIGDARAVEPLIKALGDKNILKAAANALSNIGDERAVEPLRNILEADDSLDVLEVVKEAMKNLGHETEGLDGEAKKSAKNLRKFLESDDPALQKMGFSIAKGSGVPKELLPTILGFYMWDDDRSVRGSAKSVFTKYAPAELQAKVKENWKPSYRTLSISGDKFPEAIRPFLEAFKSQDVFSDIALEPLIKALYEKPVKDDDNYWQARQNMRLAAEALGKIGEPAMELLIKALGNRNKYVRRNAAMGLGMIADARAMETLIGALDDKDLEVRTSAALGLRKFDDSQAVEAQIKALGDFTDNWNANTRAESTTAALIVEALAEIGDERAVEPLIKLLDPPLPFPFTYNDGVSGTRDSRKNMLSRRGMYQNPANALGKIGDKRAVEPLIKALGTNRNTREGWKTRAGAAEGLGMIGDKRAVEPLIKALGDTEIYVRWNATIALGEIGDSRAVEPLMQFMYSNTSRSVWVKEALRKLGHVE